MGGHLSSVGMWDTVISKAEAAKTILQRREQRKNLVAFFRGALSIIDPPAAKNLKWNWHLDLLGEYLEAAWEREILRLIINMPPREFKSAFVTRTFPAWGLGQDPAESFLCASFSNELSIEHNQDTRLIIESAWYQALFPRTRIADGENRMHKFKTTERGMRFATSVSGGAHGAGGNIQIGDDLLSPQQAIHDKYIARVKTFLDKTWVNRRNDPERAVDIQVAQRLCPDDPSGHLLESLPGEYEVITLPMEAPRKIIVHFPRSGRQIVREDGDLLHPERRGRKEIERLKKQLKGEFQAQYQQNPLDETESSISLEWFKYHNYTFDDRLSFDQIIISIDAAEKTGKTNDYCVLGVFGQIRNKHYLLDVVREKLTYPALKAQSKLLVDKWNPHNILIEDKSNGTALIQDIRAGELSPSRSWPVKAVEPQGDKKTRFKRNTPMIESGLFLLPESSHWLDDYIHELFRFPAVEHDDQVDMTSQYLDHARAPVDIYVA